MRSLIALGPWESRRIGYYTRSVVTGRSDRPTTYLHYTGIGPKGWFIVFDGKIVKRGDAIGARGMTECDEACEVFDFILLSEMPKVLANLSDKWPFFMGKLEDGREVRLLINGNDGVWVEES